MDVAQRGRGGKPFGPPHAGTGRPFCSWRNLGQSAELSDIDIPAWRNGESLRVRYFSLAACQVSHDITSDFNLRADPVRSEPLSNLKGITGRDPRRSWSSRGQSDFQRSGELSNIPCSPDAQCPESGEQAWFYLRGRCSSRGLQKGYGSDRDSSGRGIFRLRQPRVRAFAWRRPRSTPDYGR